MVKPRGLEYFTEATKWVMTSKSDHVIFKKVPIYTLLSSSKNWILLGDGVGCGGCSLSVMNLAL